MTRFKWIEFNLRKVEAHELSREEVEAAFRRINRTRVRRDGSRESLARTPSGRPIRVIWRLDQDVDRMPDVADDPAAPSIFVITAY